MIWYKESNDDIVVSTRIRLARNLEKYPFPALLKSEDKRNVSKEIEAAILNSNSTLAGDFNTINMSDISENERTALAEKHLISPAMADNAYGSVMINKDENMSIMLMEEDHIRLQIIMGGSKLKETWELADKVDNVIEENADYAFSEELGYLTACPTNTGTGMRASVMMHLPALTYTNSINKIISSASALGLTVRGLYGEGSRAYGNLYQISNQVTLGISEKEIIDMLENITSQICRHELDAREKLKKSSETEDKLWRSYGILKYARSVSSGEAKSLISDVILGENMGIIDNKEKSLMWLMVETEPALISEGKNLSPEDRDKKRAELLREYI